MGASYHTYNDIWFVCMYIMLCDIIFTKVKKLKIWYLKFFVLSTLITFKELPIFFFLLLLL